MQNDTPTGIRMILLFPESLFTEYCQISPLRIQRKRLKLGRNIFDLIRKYEANDRSDLVEQQCNFDRTKQT